MVPYLKWSAINSPDTAFTEDVARASDNWYLICLSLPYFSLPFTVADQSARPLISAGEALKPFCISLFLLSTVHFHFSLENTNSFLTGLFIFNLTCSNPLKTWNRVPRRLLSSLPSLVRSIQLHKKPLGRHSRLSVQAHPVMVPLDFSQPSSSSLGRGRAVL